MRSSLVLLLLIAGCGRGVASLDVESAPLALVPAHINLAAISGRTTGHPLRAALVWGTSPQINLLCLQFQANPVLREHCPSPFRFVPGEVESSVAIDPNGTGSFVVTLDRLPSAEVAIGTNAGRISYASVIVAEDANDDGRLNLSGFNENGSMNGFDTLLGASFSSLALPQQRVVFREGAFNTSSFFYPLAGCTPPIGFSLIEASPFALPPASPGECGSRGVETGIEVAPLDETEAKALECARGGVAYSMGPPEAMPTKEQWGQADELTFECLDAENAVVLIPGFSFDPCPVMFGYSLSGCYDDPLCEKPDWDLRANPPAWWPCQ